MAGTPLEVARVSSRHLQQLMAIYERLLHAFGPRRWWPADDHFEMMVGAVLTQNTAWSNVRVAVDNLKRANCLTPSAIHRMGEGELAHLIRPAGYFNIKARRVKNLVGYIMQVHRGSIKRMLNLSPERLRRDLLAISGIGEETADCILLYAGRHPYFVVDTYTRRVLVRHGFIPEGLSYVEVQTFMEDALPRDEKLFNEYHALVVEVGKRFCKRIPHCSGCPLECFL